MKPNKRLYKSEDPIFAGVCGGIADYFEIDPTIVRILTVVLVLAGFGLPIIAYIIALLLMPKKSAGYPDYIDVKPAAAQAGPVGASAAAGAAATPTSSAAATTPASDADGASTVDNDATVSGSANARYAQATADFATATGAPPQTPPAPAPGSGYTASNPCAYDCHTDPSAPGPSANRRLRSGITLGILLVCIGILALIGTIIDAPLWRFWPLVIVVAGIVALCTPGKNGWSLVRAGNAISSIAIGFVLLLWMLDVVGFSAFLLAFFNLWPILLVVLGLSIIGSATEKSVFKLFGSLLFSMALVLGVLSFGQVGGPLDIDFPRWLDIEITVPAPDFLSGGTPELPGER